eukprot:evm.model.scf_578.5 EVM.evm.TU.scf_578.5   scf_578:58946-60405(+)
MAAFAEVGLMPELIRAVEDLGWMLPTPIQSESVPLILGGGDIMAHCITFKRSGATPCPNGRNVGLVVPCRMSRVPCSPSHGQNSVSLRKRKVLVRMAGGGGHFFEA